MTREHIEIIKADARDDWTWRFRDARGFVRSESYGYATRAEAADAALATLDMSVAVYRDRARERLLAAGFTPFAVEETVDTIPTTYERPLGGLFFVFERRYSGRRHDLELAQPWSP